MPVMESDATPLRPLQVHPGKQIELARSIYAPTCLATQAYLPVCEIPQAVNRERKSLSPSSVFRPLNLKPTLQRKRAVSFRIFQLVFVFALAGCASEIALRPTPLNGAPVEQTNRLFRLEQSVRVVLSSGYERELESGSRWRMVGTVKEGDVFKPVDTVLTIEGAHVREAYLTVSNKRLVGFYIPGEDSFSPLDASIPINIHLEKE